MHQEIDPIGDNQQTHTKRMKYAPTKAVLIKRVQSLAKQPHVIYILSSLLVLPS